MICASFFRAANRGVADGIRGQLLVRDHEPVVVVVRMNVYVRPISSTTPLDVRRSRRSRRAAAAARTRSAARRSKLPIVRWAAKPTMSPITAEEARMPPATARTCGITSSAERMPTKTIASGRCAAARGSASACRAPGPGARAGGRPGRATISVTSRTAPKTASAGPEMVGDAQLAPLRVVSRAGRGCLPAKPSSSAVPVRDLVLAEPPAEQHLLAVAQRRGSRRGRCRGPSRARRSSLDPRCTHRAIAMRSRSICLVAARSSSLRVDAAAVAGDVRGRARPALGRQRACSRRCSTSASASGRTSASSVVGLRRE